jgi:tRNA (guanine37-N1)-methyltransferase
MKTPKSFDILGNIAIIRFPENFKKEEKKRFAEEILKNKSIKTVLEKTGKIKGRLRKQDTKYIAGEKTKEVRYKENNCIFRFNIDEVYFSPRLSNERKEIAEKIKDNEEVLVMFAGVGPFSIVIAKNSNAKRVYSNEINRKANEYTKLNIELNKVKDKVILLKGDIKKVVNKIDSFHSQINKKLINRENANLLLKDSNQFSHQQDKFDDLKIPTKFNVIVMPRPQLKNTFLKEAFILSKKGTRIYYYDFCRTNEIQKIINKIKENAKKSKKKIKILNMKNAGEIAPYKFRVRIDFKVV